MTWHSVRGNIALLQKLMQTCCVMALSKEPNQIFDLFFAIYNIIYNNIMQYLHLSEHILYRVNIY